MKNYDELLGQSDKLKDLALELRGQVAANINKAIKSIEDAASDAEDGKTDEAMDFITDAIRKLDINFENDIASLNIISDAIDEAGNEEEHDPCPGYRIGQ